MELIIAQFISNEWKNGHTTSHTSNIDKRKDLLPLQISQGAFTIILKHSSIDKFRHFYKLFHKLK
jgi:hypothetical protein